MAQKTLRPSDMAAIVGVIDPDAYAAGTYTTGWISMSDFQSIMAVVSVGDMGASATIDAKLEQASDGTGTGAKDVNNGAMTQLTQVGPDSNKQVAIQCYAEDLDLANEFTHARLSVTVAVAASDMSAIVVGSAPRYAPASENDLTSVAEIVTAG